MLAAEDKAGKTWAILDLAVSVASGRPWLDACPCPQPGRVLVFLGEGGQRATVRRLRAICAHKQLAVEELAARLRLCFRVPRLTSRADLYAMGAVLSAIQGVCQRAGAALVVTHWNETGEGRGAKRISGVGPGAWGRVLASLAVTLEFLGPLTVALAATRRRADLACAVFAGAAVVVLARPQPTTDYLGITLALVAAGCWASYILLNRVIGRRLPGAEGSAAAAGLSALLYVPVGIITLLRRPPTAGALGYAAAAGVLASAVPFLADLLALRRVPARFFGVFMSVNPVLAALVGLLILAQSLGWAEWLAITTIVAANTVSVLTTDRGRA